MSEVEVFRETCVESLSIPDSAVELCDTCFHLCESLRFVTFGARSKRESIGAEVFRDTCVESLSIPDNVIELEPRCFYLCRSLRFVTFGLIPIQKSSQGL